MRRGIVAIALVAAAQAHADDCDAQMQAIFGELRPVAQRLAEWNGKVLHDSRLERASLSSSIVARVTWSNNAMQYGDQLCALPYSVKQGTVAHEFGHLLQFALFPKVRMGAAILNESPVAHEHAANHFGAKVLRAARIDSTPYLATLDAGCQDGSDYSCRAAESWRAGLLW